MDRTLTDGSVQFSYWKTETKPSDGFPQTPSKKVSPVYLRLTSCVCVSQLNLSSTASYLLSGIHLKSWFPRDEGSIGHLFVYDQLLCLYTLIC